MIDMLCAGGAQRQLVELSIGFKERGYDVAFLIHYRAFDDYYDSVLHHADIPIYDVNESNYLLRILKMRRKMKSYNPDIVIAFLEVPSFIAEMASIMPHRWKLIVGERSASPKKLTKKRLRFFLHCHRFADYIVANSHANIDIVKKIAPEISDSKLKVIYNSLKSEKFEIDPDYKFHGCKEKRNILIASSHQYLKNLDGVIEAVRLLPEDRQRRLRIDWYGHNKFSSYDHSLAEGKEKIEKYGLSDVFSFHDATLDIYNCMRQADGIGLFSFYEGFPNAICEGMFLAKPIIATKVSDIPLLLKEKDNAFLADVEPRSIALALERFLSAREEQLQQMGARNRVIAQQLFSSKLILNQYEHLF